jgi:hypothetical protein
MPALKSDKLHAKWPVFGYAVSGKVLEAGTNGEPGTLDAVKGASN